MATISNLYVTLDANTGGFQVKMDNAVQTMGRLGTAQQGMKSLFQERFQHIGLKLFSEDLLRSMGLASEARIIIGTLNTALTGVLVSFGAMGAPVAIGAAALVALAAVVAKASETLGDHRDQIEQVMAANEKSLTSYDNEIGKVGQFKDAFDKLTPAIATYQAALDSARKITLEDQRQKIVQDMREISTAMIEATKSHLTFGSALAAVGAVAERVWGGVRSSMAQALAIMESALPAAVQKTIAALSKPFDNKAFADLNVTFEKLRVQLEDIEKRGGKAFDKVAQAALDAKKAAEDLADQADKFRTSFDEAMSKTASKTRELLQESDADYSSSFNRKLEKVSETFRKARAEEALFFDSERDRVAESVLDFDESAKKFQQIDDAQNKYMTASWAAEAAKRQGLYESEFGSLSKIAESTTKTLVKDFSQAFVEALAEGKDFFDSMGTMLKQLVIQTTEAIIEMNILKSIFAPGTPFFGLPGHAAGGRPDIGGASIVGERGPELFIPDTAGTIVPTSDLMGMGRQGVNVTLNQTNHFNVDKLDPKSLTTTVADQMRRNSREGIELALQAQRIQDSNKGGLAI